jgi:lipid-binding SYLF domain-containing protein
MRSFLVASLVLFAVVSGFARAVAADPQATVVEADQILRESMAMPGKRIPASLLASAEGVAIVPNVIKIGFVAALRRGHGVLMVRDAKTRSWTLPQFVTLTGGSVGWQAGIQDTDVILVFMTRKSVEGIFNGRFTIGADASVAAGPVGRNAAAATDARLKAEILSYSRSRGLFVGVSLDGTAIEMDPAAQSLYYSTPVGQPPGEVPPSAMELLQSLTQYSDTTRVEPPPTAQAQPGQPTPAAPLPPEAGPEVPMPVVSTVREQLATSARELYGIVDEPWRKYLALPRAVFEGDQPPRVADLQASLAQYNRVAQSAQYEALSSRVEFQRTYAMLRDYVEELQPPAAGQLALPPPPAAR